MVDATPGVVVAGGWTARRVCGYQGETGELLWSRKDLHQTQAARDLGHGRVAIESASASEVVIVDGASGDTVSKVASAGVLHGSAFEPLAVIAKASETDWLELRDVERATRVWRRRMVPFALLDASFSPEALLISEVAGPVRCYSLEGEQTWQWNVPDGTHVIRSCWNVELGKWIAALWFYRDSSIAVICVLSTAGELESVKEVGYQTTVDFLAGGEALVCSSGDVLSVTDGEVVWSFCKGLATSPQ